MAININPKHKGLFTSKAKSAGYGTSQSFAKHVLANTHKYDHKTVLEANFARNSQFFHHRGSK